MKRGWWGLLKEFELRLLLKELELKSQLRKIELEFRRGRWVWYRSIRYLYLCQHRTLSTLIYMNKGAINIIMI